MIPREPSRTAMAAAGYRAAHQVLDGGRIFTDPLAVPILGWQTDAIARDAEAWNAQRGMRIFIASRSRIAEDTLRSGVEERGVEQLVVLGAGLDTFAYRNPFEGCLAVFEVDHPATQAWKRERLEASGIAVPDSLVYTPVDFETEELADRLAQSGLDPMKRTLFTWLGVVPYLTREAIFGTLGIIAAQPGGAEVVFDYGEPREALSEEIRKQYEERAARVAAAGEPFLSYFDPQALASDLTDLGFDRIEDLTVDDMLQRLVGLRPATPSRSGGHVLHAAR